MKFLFTKENEKLIHLYDKNILTELRDQLNETKSLIDDYSKEWEIVKKQIHDHEYVYTSSYYNKNISKISPISRSYFKFREIYQEYNIINEKNKNKIVCLAEAPGGFIQSIIHLLSFHKIEKIYGITLLSSNNSVPKWNHSLKRYPNIKFLVGNKGDGDLYDFSNVISLIKEIGKNSVDLVTGDGGFDYSLDYSKQEENSLKLIYSEVFLALNIQKEGGTFICKIFDIFMKETLILLFILKESYNEVFIYKPKMSRFSNSEKYIVCLGYKGYNKEINSLLCHSFEKNKIDYKVSNTFIKDILNLNDIYCNQQINHIKKGIQIIKENNLNKNPTNDQIILGIQWCKKYNIDINNKCNFLNNTFT